MMVVDLTSVLSSSFLSSLRLCMMILFLFVVVDIVIALEWFDKRDVCAVDKLEEIFSTNGLTRKTPKNTKWESCKLNNASNNPFPIKNEFDDDSNAEDVSNGVAVVVVVGSNKE